MLAGSLPLNRNPSFIAVLVTGTVSSLIFTVTLAVALDAKNENSDFGATSLLFFSTENGAGVKAVKYTWVQGSVVPPPGLASYATTFPTVPKIPTAATS